MPVGCWAYLRHQGILPWCFFIYGETAPADAKAPRYFTSLEADGDLPVLSPYSTPESATTHIATDPSLLAAVLDSNQ